MLCDFLIQISLFYLFFSFKLPLSAIQSLRHTHTRFFSRLGEFLYNILWVQL